MSLIRISAILLVFISTRVICYGPDYCKDITINGNFSRLEIYRHYGKDLKESIRLYNKDIEIVVELSSDMSLKFKESTKRKLLNDTALHKFSASVNQTNGFLNCEVERRGIWIICKLPSGLNVVIYLWGSHWDVRHSLFITPFKNSKYVLILDQNKRNRYRSIYPRNETQKLCDKSHINLEECKKPAFVQQLKDYYFGKLEGVLDTTNGTKFGHLLLFLIDGRHKYCFTIEEKLSQECNSSINMKTLFSECLEETDESIDPLIWVFIALVIITVILIIAIVCTDCIRKKQKKLSGTDWTTVGLNTLSNKPSEQNQKSTATSGSTVGTSGIKRRSKTEKQMTSKPKVKKTSPKLQKPKK